MLLKFIFHRKNINSCGQPFCAGYCNDKPAPGWLLKMTEDMVVYEKDSWPEGQKNASKTDLLWYRFFPQLPNSFRACFKTSSRQPRKGRADSQLQLLASVNVWSRSTPRRSSAMWRCSHQCRVWTVHCGTWTCRHFFGGTYEWQMWINVCFMSNPKYIWEAAVKNAWTNAWDPIRITMITLLNQW